MEETFERWQWDYYDAIFQVRINFVSGLCSRENRALLIIKRWLPCVQNQVKKE